MKIKYGKQIFDMDVLENETILQLKDRIKAISKCDNIKLILSGKMLSDEVIIANLPFGNSLTVTMIASEFVDDESNYKNIRVRDDLDAQPKKVSKKQIHAKTPSTYRFGDIRTLPGLPNEDKARAILEVLANDPGVLAVLEKHKWSVGALCELYPEGYVGVSDVCVMGLNENKGQRILLRLRTDDLQGFRKILSIKKVLYHELAHNVHSEHDDQFYILMRQIERECNELDWRNSKGYSLGGPEIYRPSDDDDNTFINNHINNNTEQTVFRLGGSSIDPLVQALLPARILAGNAAILRLSEEEKEIEDHCSSNTNNSSNSKILVSNNNNTVSSSNNSNVDNKVKYIEPVSINEQDNNNNGDSDNDNNSKKDSGYNDHNSHRVIIMEEGSNESASSTSDNSNDIVAESEIEDINALINNAMEVETQQVAQVAPLVSISVLSQWQSHFTEIRQKILSQIDDSIAFTLSLESEGSGGLGENGTISIEKLLKLREAIEELLESSYKCDNNSVNNNNNVITKIEDLKAIKCLRILSKIIGNIKDAPNEEKYRKINKSTKTFQQLIESIQGAKQILYSVGFQERNNSSSSSDSSNTSNQHQELYLRAIDQGLLYVVHSMIENAIKTIETTIIIS